MRKLVGFLIFSYNPLEIILEFSVFVGDSLEFVYKNSPKVVRLY